MRKKFLNQMNVMLGALSLSLAGCHTAKQTVPSPENPPAKKYGPPHLEVIEEKYGIPAKFLEEPIEEAPADTVAEPLPVKYGAPPVIDEVKCLYGVPSPRQ